MTMSVDGFLASGFFYILKSKTGSSVLFSLCGLFFSHIMWSHVIVIVLLITDICSNHTLDSSLC